MLQNAALSVSSREGVASSKETMGSPVRANRGFIFKLKAFAGRPRGLGRNAQTWARCADLGEIRRQCPNCGQDRGQTVGRGRRTNIRVRVLTDVGCHIGSNADADSRRTARRDLLSVRVRFPRQLPQALSIKNEMRQMNSNDGLRVLVARRGEKFIWELHRAGLAQPVKFSVPIFLSEEFASASGAMARTAHLARLAKRFPETGVASRAPRRTRKTPPGGRGMGS